MFALKSLSSDIFHCLAEKKEYTVGRKACDIILNNDSSISRKHALLKIEDDKVSLVDCGSKYHTSHNGTQVQPNTEVVLKHNDEIHFGALVSKFRFVSISIVTTSSGLSPTDKELVKKNVTAINGKYLENWSVKCTHLTIDKIVLSVKMLLALIYEIPFVLPKYWSDYAKSVSDQTNPPDIENYTKIPVGEILLNRYNFQPDSRRKTLFKGKLFIFCKEEFKKRMEAVILSSGGECISWEVNPILPNEIRKSNKEFIIIQTDDIEDNVSLRSVVKSFYKEGKRTIPLSEIALAVVTCSCETDCNPSFNKKGTVFKNQTQSIFHSQNVLIGSTQTENSEIKQEPINDLSVVIPPTLDENVDLVLGSTKAPDTSISKKRCGEQNNENVSKKIKTEMHQRKKSIEGKTLSDSFMKPTASQKRKAEDEHPTTSQSHKSKASKPNPFALFKKPTSKSSTSVEESPFKITKPDSQKSIMKSSSSIQINPFSKKVVRAKHEPEPEVTETSLSDELETKRCSVLKKSPGVQVQTHRPLKVELSAVTDYSKDLNKTRLSNVSWISKSDGNISKEIVKEQDDPELKKIEQLFQDCVLVDVLSMIIKEHKYMDSTVGEHNVSNGKTNFKKFKKVKPVYPHCRIIVPRHFVEPGDTSEIINITSDHEDDDQLAGMKNKKGKRTSKQIKFF